MDPSSRMPKTVLVICSFAKGTDYPRQDNQIMLKSLLGDDFVPEFMGEYPANLPTDKLFDAVLFGGCNVLTWLFRGDYEPGMKKLSTILKDDGIVIFVENKNYVTKLAGEDHYASHVLTMPINSIKLQMTLANDNSGLKQDIISTWNKYFTRTDIDKYIVYKKQTSGGRRKNAKRKTRKIRKTRRHK